MLIKIDRIIKDTAFSPIEDARSLLKVYECSAKGPLNQAWPHKDKNI